MKKPSSCRFGQPSRRLNCGLEHRRGCDSRERPQHAGYLAEAAPTELPTEGGFWFPAECSTLDTAERKNFKLPAYESFPSKFESGPGGTRAESEQYCSPQPTPKQTGQFLSILLHTSNLSGVPQMVRIYPLCHIL
jgi:hypothetical protein